MRSPPALGPAAAALLGCALAHGLQLASAVLPGALTVASLALAPGPRRLGLALGLGLLGTVVQWSGPVGEAVAPDPGRPVSLTVEARREWRQDRGWSTLARGVLYRQGDRIRFWPRPVLVLLEPGIEPPPGRTLRLRGYLRPGTGAANQPPQRPGPWRIRLESLRLLGDGGGGGERGVTAWREETVRTLRSHLGPGAGAAIALALLTGRSEEVPASWKRGLRRLGLGHLLAVSGLHVGLVAGGVLLLCRRLPAGIRLALAALATAGYLLLVGPRPSLLRATLMTLPALTAAAWGRPALALNSLALAATGLALLDPPLILEPGFQLSVAATAGILVLAPWLAAEWTLVPGWLRTPLAVSLGAQLATLPVALPLFHLACPGAPLINLVAIPWTALTLTGALAAAALAPWTGGSWSRGLLDLLAAPFGWPAELRPGLLGTFPFSAGPVRALLLSLLTAWLLRRPRRALAGLLLLPLLSLQPGREGSATEAVFLDVGQGDAVLLRGGGEALLVDGGGWRRGEVGGRVLLPVLARMGVRRLRALVLSHPDHDHCGGLVEVASYLPARELWVAPGWAGTPCIERLLRLPGIRLRPLWAGEEAGAGPWRLRALHPRPGHGGPGNEGSLVLLARAPGHRLLLTGDIPSRVEERLLASTPSDLRARVLKVAHHGSRSSTSSGFLKAVDPAVAVISVGAGNPYGHPAPEVLERLAARRTLILRTDRSGMVRLRLAPASPLRLELPGAPRGHR